MTDLLQEGIKLLFDLQISTLPITALLIIVLYSIFWYGRYSTFEKFLMGFVILMALSFILVFSLVKPDFSSIVKGLVPSLPSGAGSFALIAAIAGTTCSAAVFIMRSTVVAEKGLVFKRLEKREKDSAVSASVMFFLSLIIMAVSAGTLHLLGMKLTNTVEMISLFEPLGGRAAAFLLILGIAGAGISTIFPMLLIAPWLISDFRGTERNIQSPLYRVLGLAGILCGLGAQFTATTPPLIMVFSQAFQALILPAVAIPIFLLINRKEIMLKETANRKMNFGLVTVIAFSIITSYFAIVGLFT